MSKSLNEVMYLDLRKKEKRHFHSISYPCSRNRRTRVGRKGIYNYTLRESEIKQYLGIHRIRIGDEEIK